MQRTLAVTAGALLVASSGVSGAYSEISFASPAQLSGELSSAHLGWMLILFGDNSTISGQASWESAMHGNETIRDEATQIRTERDYHILSDLNSTPSNLAADSLHLRGLGIGSLLLFGRDLAFSSNSSRMVLEGKSGHHCTTTQMTQPERQLVATSDWYCPGTAEVVSRVDAAGNLSIPPIQVERLEWHHIDARCNDGTLCMGSG